MTSSSPTNPCPAPVPTVEEAIQFLIDEVRGLRADVAALGGLRPIIDTIADNQLELLSEVRSHSRRLEVLEKLMAALPCQLGLECPVQ